MYNAFPGKYKKTIYKCITMIPKDFSAILRFAFSSYLAFVLVRKTRLAVSVQPGGWACWRPERKAIDLTRRSRKLTATGGKQISPAAGGGVALERLR